MCRKKRGPGVWWRGGGVKRQITFFGKHATALGVNRRLHRERRGEERAGRAKNQKKKEELLSLTDDGSQPEDVRQAAVDGLVRRVLQEVIT